MGIANAMRRSMYIYKIYFFRQITTFIKVHMAFVFGLQNLKLIEFITIFQLKGLKPKYKGRTNFYEFVKPFFWLQAIKGTTVAQKQRPSELL